MKKPYRYFVYNKRRTKRAVIVPWGVVIEHLDGGLTDTNIRPSGLYPQQTRLTREQQVNIARTATEGVYYSPAEVEMIYRSRK